MLAAIREKTQGIIASFILALIVIPFALWGINSYFDRGGRSYVASVDGEKISEQAYRSTLEGFRRQLDPHMMDNPEIKKMVIDSLIDQSILVRDADSQGYRIGDERLATMIRTLPYFQSGGRFDPALYQSLLRREGLGVREFENQRRSESVTAQIQAGLVTSGVVTETEIAALLRLLKQEREIAYASIGADKLQATVVVVPETVQQYYDAHPDSFRTAEQLRIQYLRLSARDSFKDYQPTEAELRKLYTEDGSKITRPETRRAAHILVAAAAGASEDDAKKALAKIQQIEKQARVGADFAKLAQSSSDDKESAAKGGDLGEVRPGLLPKPLEQAVFELKPGELTKPVRTEFGYHLAKLLSYQPAVKRSFEEMRPALTKQLRQRKGEERYYEASEKFRNLVYEQADSLTPAAEALGLKVETSDWFDRSGGNGIAGYPRVIEAAFSSDVLTQARNSDALEVSGDTLVAIRVAEHRPSTLKPLADVKPQIERLLRQEGAQKAARELGERMVQELNAGGATIEAAARKHGLAYRAPKKLTHDQPQGFDVRVVEAAFRAARPEGGKPVYGGVELGGQGYAVYAVTRAKDGDPTAADAATKDKAKRLLTARRGSDYYANYRAGLKQNADIKIYREQL